MLALYQRYAQAITGLRPLLLLMALCALAAFLYLLFFGSPEQGAQWLLPALLGGCFCLALSLIGTFFAKPRPTYSGRLRAGLQRLWLHSLAWLLSLIFMLWLVLFLRVLFRVVRQTFF